jgi:hypothetical protein
MPRQHDAFDWDGQDQSEVFDEDNQETDEAGSSKADMKTLEEIPDVLDTTSAVGDEDDDEARIAEDMTAAEILEFEADADATDLEDDDLAARMPEALHVGMGAPSRSATAEDETPLVYAGVLDEAMEDGATPSLEADRLTDKDIRDLGYAGETSPPDAPDGEPGGPTRLQIVLRNGLWLLTRDGVRLHEYAHADRAVHEAAALASELRRSGEPAVVHLEAADGKVIEVTENDPPANAPASEASAVIPERSGSG